MRQKETKLLAWDIRILRVPLGFGSDAVSLDSPPKMLVAKVLLSLHLAVSVCSDLCGWVCIACEIKEPPPPLLQG